MNREKVIKEWERVLSRDPLDAQWDLIDDTLALLKEQEGVILALEQANTTINYINDEKENAIKEIEKRKDFNLKCDGQPEWLRKGIDVGLNTALAIIKGTEERAK